MQGKVKNGFFIFLFTVLLLPMLQQQLSIIKSGPLNGIFYTAPDIVFSWAKWMDGSYQDGKSKFINDNIGLRPDLIRTNNQVDYSLFGKVHSEWRILAGRNNVTYQDVYVYAYTGKDYVGYDTILRKMNMLKAIQDTLQHMGKSLVLIYAPGKAHFYPESIPEEFASKQPRLTNMETYTRLGDSLGINQINFNSWFVSIRSKSMELLYPKQGFHWSVYGSLIAADSFEKYMALKNNIHLPRILLSNFTRTTKARDTDNDLDKGLNLIVPTASETFTYPEVSYTMDKLTRKPNVIYIGDSFLFTWMNSGFMDNTNERWQIWYYFRYLLNSNNRIPEQQSLSGTDWQRELQKNDCVVLMYTSRNLAQLGDGFIEQAYAYYYPNKY